LFTTAIEATRRTGPLDIADRLEESSGRASRTSLSLGISENINRLYANCERGVTVELARLKPALAIFFAESGTGADLDE
jgi:hypothetical protein